MNTLNTHETPPNGGWMFRQSQTGFVIQRPQSVAMTHAQVTNEIIKHRLKNPAITGKHKLSTDPAVVGEELLAFNRLRLGIPEPSASPSFFQPSRSLSANVLDAAAKIKRAAAGTAVVLDWLQSGGAPVSQELANQRAATCVGCIKNVEGSWYTTAPAQIIKAALEARKDLALVTPIDAALKSCDVCRCLNRLKVWCPLDHIVKRTKPEIMAEFPSSCWIKCESQSATQPNEKADLPPTGERGPRSGTEGVIGG